MPFTLSHPAIVVPLKRWFPQLLDLSGLVIGSLSPDFEYFLRLRPIRSISHEFIGVPLLCLPTGLIFWLMFDRVMKRPLNELTPRWIRLRLRSITAPTPMGTARAWMRVIVSIVLGAFSHIVWDSFTHENGWFVERMLFLNVSMSSGPKLYKILQHLSTFVGFGAIATWSWRWLQKQPPAPSVPRSGISDMARVIVISLIAVSACGFGAIVIRVQAPEIISQGAYGWVVRFVIATISSCWLSLFIYSFLFRLIKPPLAYENG